AEPGSRNLVGRDPRTEVRPGGLPCLAAGQEGRRRPRVVAAAVAVGPPLVAGEAAEHEQVVLERGQRLEERRQGETGPLARRRPTAQDRAVGHVDERHSARYLRTDRTGTGDVRGKCSRRGGHGLEPRQGDDRTDAPQDPPPRDPTAARHGLSPVATRIWNGSLSATATTKLDNR